MTWKTTVLSVHDREDRSNRQGNYENLVMVMTARVEKCYSQRLWHCSWCRY